MATKIVQPAGVQESEEFWDRFAASAAIHPANLYRYNLISGMAAVLPGAKDCVVDLGCGNGVLLAHFHERGIGKRLIGFDGSLAIVERNRPRIPYAEFQQADLQLPERFPLKGVADIVTCSEVVEHMPNYIPAFRIAFECLRPGGHLILTTQGGKRRRHDIELLGHLRHYDINVLAAEVAAAGFKIHRKQQAGWPALTLQKIAASMFMGQVSKELASHAEPSALFKFACQIIGMGLKVSFRSFGPQLVITAQKPLGTTV